MSDNNPIPPRGVEPEEQKSGKVAQKLKFYTVVGIMSALCLGFIWFLFSPEDTEQSEGATGLNTTVPAATVQNTQDDKRKAYEQEQYKAKQRDKQQTLQEIADNYLTDDKPEKEKEPKPDPIRTSHETYRHINRQMSTFYQTPKEDPQVAELKRQVVELTARLDEKEKTPEPADPLELIEKSYELAAKYYPGGGQMVKRGQSSSQNSASDKNLAVTVQRTIDKTTSTLAEPAELTLVERN